MKITKMEKIKCYDCEFSGEDLYECLESTVNKRKYVILCGSCFAERKREEESED